ncbi:mammalian ependymin-related protein 1-like isoform X2 [Mytilus edulis]|uniref:mammalian ependymin-related protein 1-like isoform X2 n=1 Tax=Mytilus edulis TaxID=6550 RepID=UPI0039EF6C3E
MFMLVIGLLVLSTYMHTAESCCCMPEKFELHEYVEDIFTWPSAMIQTGYANISFDLEVKKSVFFFYDVKLNGKDVPTPTYLFDHSSGFVYVYDLRSKYCKKMPIGRMNPVCVPANQSTDTTHLGTGKETLSVKTYQSTAGNQTTSTTVTKEKCYLISSELNDSEYPISLRRQFYGTTLGIKDMSVFKIPAICKKIFWNTQEIPEVSRRVFHPFYL